MQGLLKGSWSTLCWQCRALEAHAAEFKRSRPTKISLMPIEMLVCFPLLVHQAQSCTRPRTTSSLCLYSTRVSVKLLNGGAICCVLNEAMQLAGPVLTSHGLLYGQCFAVYQQDFLVWTKTYACYFEYLVSFSGVRWFSCGPVLFDMA